MHNLTQILWSDSNMLRPIQSSTSVVCGMFRVYVAHVTFTSKYHAKFKLKDQIVMHFADHMIQTLIYLLHEMIIFASFYVLFDGI